MSELPLTDGTTCRVEDYALSLLRDEYGITQGRIRKGAGGHAAVVVVPRMGDTREELSLREFLSCMVYEMPRLLPGEKWICADGDPRNLTRENIAVKSGTLCTGSTETNEQEQSSQNATFLDTPQIERQLEMLALAVDGKTPEKCKPLLSIALGILRNEELAQEVAGEATLSIVEAIRAAQFRGKTDAEFYGWIRTIFRNQCSARLQGVVQNVIGDVENSDKGKRAFARRLRESLPSNRPYIFATNGSEHFAVVNPSSRKPTADEQTGFFEE